MKKRKLSAVALAACLLVACNDSDDVEWGKEGDVPAEQTFEDAQSLSDERASIEDETVEEDRDNPKEVERADDAPLSDDVSKSHAGEADDNGYVAGIELPTDPTYVDGVLLASKRYPLPADFNPGEDPEARAAFEEMARAATADGLELVAFSTFRSYDYQVQLYNDYVARDGKDAADRYSARPGFSEHQTGLAFDISGPGGIDFGTFGETKEGKWLRDNAHRFGFILRYPEGKEHITGYMYESWHFRYVGKEIAPTIYEKQLTLEEYLGVE